MNQWRIDKLMGDNNTSFQNFCENVEGAEARMQFSRLCHFGGLQVWRVGVVEKRGGEGGC